MSSKFSVGDRVRITKIGPDAIAGYSVVCGMVGKVESIEPNLGYFLVLDEPIADFNGNGFPIPLGTPVYPVCVYEEEIENADV